MNKDRRNELKNAIANIEDIINDISFVSDQISEVAQDEQDSFDSLPEGLQMSERGEKMEDNVSDLESICMDLHDLSDQLTSAMKEIEDIIKR